ncbi:filamentous hemagglutinin N-terminal domain-containing protein [Microcoleus sp. Pol14C2]|uniref:two-partner secretion domain-containing protein n=1 Tax=unclassified Microcoleus TaxID=2642155 RepID=UPI002FCF14D2
MIAKSWFDRCWQWQIGGCVAIFGTLLVGGGDRANAQIVPDNTLGAESSVVTPDVIKGIQGDRIDGGAIRGANLFHSFEQLSVLEGRGAYFTNPAGILNILSRVTGANRSKINGRLGVDGNANLFLINPNGIVFGPSASLDVQGSFLATTANAVKLGDTGLFSASQPSSSNLLSVSPSALWFNAVAAQPIVNRSQAPSLIDQPNSGGLPRGLQVQPGRTLALVGGDVLLDSGRLTAAGGRIELGSVARVGEVSLSSSGNGFALGYDSINNFGNISLSNGASVNASGEGGGDIQIRGGQFSMTQSSYIFANTWGAQNGKQVLVRATEVELRDASYLTADVGTTGTGTGGDIRIDTGRLLVRDGARVSASSDGSGKRGNLQITATDSVEVSGNSANGGIPSVLVTGGNGGGDGDAGNLRIDTGRLLVRDGALVSTSTFDSGNGGNLQITATDSVEVSGTSVTGQFGSSLSTSGTRGGGNLSINTRRLLVRDRGEVSVYTGSSGKSGSLQITAADSIEVIGESTANGSYNSRLVDQSSRLGSGGGDAGELSINTRRLLVRDGAEVSVATFGSAKGGSLQIMATDSVEVIGSSANGQFVSVLSAQSQGSGDAGNLRIDTGRLRVRDGARVSADTSGSGKGGSLQIMATDLVEVIGSSADGRFISGLFTESQRSGDAGSLRIDAGRLLVSDGAVVSATTFGSGKGGSLEIKATDSVEVIGTSASGQFGSGLFTSSQGSGDAGNLRIDTGRLLVRDRARVSTGTIASGKGGSLEIKATDSVEVIGRSVDGQLASGLFTSSQGSGDAGNLSINTGRLLVRDGAQVQSGTVSEGNGGSLQIAATDSVEVSGTSADGRFGSGLSAQSQGSGDAGNLSINTGRLQVSDGAAVSTATRGSGKGGSLQITARDSIELMGNSASSQFDRGLFTSSEGSGDAGNLSINTGRLQVSDGAQVSTTTRDSGKGGSLQITARDSVEVIGISADGRLVSGLLAQSYGSRDAGNLSINTGRLQVSDGAVVSSATTGQGKGGSLQITARNSVEVIGRSANGQFRSGLSAESQGSGDAGNLSINTGRLQVSDGARVSTSSTREGTAGNINITARDTLEANNGTIATSAEQSSGGSINITAPNIRLSGNSDITSQVNSGAGGGGNIDIKADSILAFNDSDILAFARDGRGGNITLNTPVFFGENYTRARRSTDPATLERNNRVDINATGNLASGNIALPNTTSIQNSLTELPENRIDTDRLLASSCIVRRSRPTRGSFTVTGTGGLPQRPGDVQMSDFPTVDVETLPSDTTSSNTNPNRSWQKGDPIVEPQGVYRLPNGKLVMSRECR